MREQTERVYVKVSSDFDCTGYMQPRTITWADGRTFQIDEVRDFRPAASFGGGRRGDRYTIMIHGAERYLFFERTDPGFASHLGRWFVELPAV